MFQVYSESLGDFATNAHFVVHEGQALAIDAPPRSLSFYQDLVKRYNLTWRYLLLTHSHFDHIADAKAIQDLGIKVAICDLDKGNCQKPGSDGLPLMVPVPPFTPDFSLSEGPLALDSFHIKLIHTPGHSPGGMCFCLDTLMFSGDTIFAGAIGNLNFPTCDIPSMLSSLKRLVSEPINYKVFPGHGPATRLDSEKPFLKTMIYELGQICH